MSSTSREILSFTKNLSVMIKAGIPIVEALDSLSASATSVSVRQLISQLARQVASGNSLRQALSAYPRVFSPVYLSLVSVGEETGTLDDSLGYLATELGKLSRLRQKIQSALLYPLLVIFTMSFIGIGLSLFVLPQLVGFFAAFNTQLPLSTRILLWFAQIMQSYGLLIITIIVGSILVLAWLVRRPPLQSIFDHFVLRLPYLGRFILLSTLSELCRNLAILLTRGVPIVRSLELAAGSANNTTVRLGLTNLAHAIASGASLADSLAPSLIFPPLLVQLLKAGEQTGSLAESFDYLAQYYESELTIHSQNLTTILEPALLILVGLLVGFLALAIIGPIYQITGSLGG